MARDAMTQSSDSMNPVAPLRCSADERPPVILTPAAIVEIRDNRPTLALPDSLEQGYYECPFCSSPCARDYCYSCRSELLEDAQDE